MKYDHWGKNTYAFLSPKLEQAQALIRIATGFFTIQGYDLIRPVLVGKHIQIMVGYDETSKERLREKLIADIMLHLSLWDVQNRREAVLDLVRKIQQKQLEIIELGSPDILEARLRKQDHAKIFIIDTQVVIVGSANLTVNGLKRNVEGVAEIEEPPKVMEWVGKFEHYWQAPDTYDLTQALLEALLKWLELSKPYDVYLKTIQALMPEDPTEAPRSNYKMPVAYQRVVIERVLRQLKEWYGAMLVASTGLGKTIMATHISLRLKHDKRIQNVLVFCPKQVQDEWGYALHSAGVAHEIFTLNLLDRGGRRGAETRRLQRAFDLLDEKYLIIIDESQYFKNKLKASNGKLRKSVKRLVDTVNEKKALIILLTATPFAKGVEDINNQLYLLPHLAETSYLTDKGQYVIPGIRDAQIAPKAWKVINDEGFFDEFINLPVCTVISTSQVAKNFATHTEQGDYVEFGATRRWLPQISITKIKAAILLEEQMNKAITEGYFRHQVKSFQNRGKWQRTESMIRKEAEVAWLSSPLALREVVESTINERYDVQFVRSPESRETILAPILQSLKAMSYKEDEKFMMLCDLLSIYVKKGEKVLIFTERRATAIYIEKGLNTHNPMLHVANTVQETEAGDYKMKSDDELFDIIIDFAPEANADKITSSEHKRKSYDVLIATDAHGAGVNLQDASVAISYDLAWTADTIIQRAGRILRFWKHPREVNLFVFMGKFENSKEGQHKTNRVQERLDRLRRRSRQAEKFSELPVLPDKDSVEYKSLGELSALPFQDSIDTLGQVDLGLVEEFSGVSRFLLHITELRQNLDYVETIPDDITSALAYPGKKHQLYLLFHYDEQHYWVLYDIEKKSVLDIQEDELLDLIQCSFDTPLANTANADFIESVAQQARSIWIEQQELPNEAQVERICALHLIPQKGEEDFASSLAEQITPQSGKKN